MAEMFQSQTVIESRTMSVKKCYCSVHDLHFSGIPATLYSGSVGCPAHEQCEIAAIFRSWCHIISGCVGCPAQVTKQNAAIFPVVVPRYKTVVSVVPCIEMRIATIQ